MENDMISQFLVLTRPSLLELVAALNAHYLQGAGWLECIHPDGGQFTAVLRFYIEAPAR